MTFMVTLAHNSDLADHCVRIYNLYLLT